MAEGLQGRTDAPPFAGLVHGEGGTVSGLKLLDGALVLKVERQGAAGQVRIEDGAGFDPAGSVGLFLPWGEDHVRGQKSRRIVTTREDQ